MTTNDTSLQTSHGTAVQINGKGILLRGASGSGKSSIAMRLLDNCILNNTSGFLIADDRVYLKSHNNGLYVSCPDNLHGLIEIRGLGIVTLNYLKEAKLDLVVDLVPQEAFERYPHHDAQTATLATTLCNVTIARIQIVERNPDAPAIIRMFFHTQDKHGQAAQVEI